MSTFKAFDTQLNTEMTSHESIKTVTITSELQTTGSDTDLGPHQLSFNLAPDYIDISYAVVGCFGFVINLFIFTILITQRSENANFSEYLMMSQVFAILKVFFNEVFLNFWY